MVAGIWATQSHGHGVEAGVPAVSCSIDVCLFAKRTCTSQSGLLRSEHDFAPWDVLDSTLLVVKVVIIPGTIFFLESIISITVVSVHNIHSRLSIDSSSVSAPVSPSFVVLSLR